MLSAFVFRCNGCKFKCVVRTKDLSARDLNQASRHLVSEGWMIGADGKGSTHHCPDCAVERRVALKAQAEADRKLRDKFIRKVAKVSERKREERKERKAHGKRKKRK